ncbi:MAG TPA: phosphate ABC transporter permease subunit PstC [Burkholderiales bacterium]|nr:phosphate ABC transporter permease subunit PstC [Burkholderiales bacterium]
MDAEIDRRKASVWQARQDKTFRLLAQMFAVTVLLLLLAIVVSLAIGAAPAFQKFGLRFLVESEWNPVTEVFGALVPIFGTLATSAIALLIAIPLSFGIALFLTELCPVGLRTPLGIVVELLAAVPSIIYGMWGLFVFAPAFADRVQPALQATVGRLPGVGALFQGPPMGIGILTAGIILAFMVVPFIAAVMRDVFEIVPPILKESAYGLGCTTWEVVWHVVLPYTKAGVMGGVMLGLGRALGETMAVTFVIGNSYDLSFSLFSAGNSIASSLANEFAEAHSDMHASALIALGLLLFAISLIVLAAAKLLLLRVTRAEGRQT